jgi:hypothetical protein
MNHSNLKKAIVKFAKFSKKYDSRSGGMSIKRLMKLIGGEIKSKGFCASPIYYLEQYPDISYQEGSLFRWNHRGGFNITIG